MGLCGDNLLARILIMDDNAAVRLALHKLLESLGHDITEASNAAEGAKFYTSQCPDLVITDLLMPERDGIEALLELRAKYPLVKTIVISGEAPEFLPIAEDLGAHCTIAKPFKNQDVINAVNRLLEQTP
jgi:CheY-like chemotaxis protein